MAKLAKHCPVLCRGRPGARAPGQRSGI